jgi:hypothetical protein
MRLLKKLLAYVKVLPRGRRNRTDLVGWMIRRPALLGAIGTYESAVLVSGRMPTTLKALASLKVSSRVGCPF